MKIAGYIRVSTNHEGHKEPPKNHHDGQLLPREDYTVDIVRDIFDKYLEGWGHDKVARHLTNRDIPTPSKLIDKANAGLYWQGSTVKKILQNPHYVGDLVQGRETTTNVTNKSRKVNNPKDWITISDAHIPIISREVFEQVQKLLEQKARRGRCGTRAKYISLPILPTILNEGMECGIVLIEVVIYVVLANMETMRVLHMQLKNTTYRNYS